VSKPERTGHHRGVGPLGTTGFDPREHLDAGQGCHSRSRWRRSSAGLDTLGQSSRAATSPAASAKLERHVGARARRGARLGGPPNAARAAGARGRPKKRAVAPAAATADDPVVVAPATPCLRRTRRPEVPRHATVPLAQIHPMASDAAPPPTVTPARALLARHPRVFLDALRLCWWTAEGPLPSRARRLPSSIGAASNYLVLTNDASRLPDTLVARFARLGFAIPRRADPWRRASPPPPPCCTRRSSAAEGLRGCAPASWLGTDGLGRVRARGRRRGRAGRPRGAGRRRWPCATSSGFPFVETIDATLFDGSSGPSDAGQSPRRVLAKHRPDLPQTPRALRHGCGAWIRVRCSRARSRCVCIPPGRRPFVPPWASRTRPCSSEAVRARGHARRGCDGRRPARHGCCARGANAFGLSFMPRAARGPCRPRGGFATSADRPDLRFLSTLVASRRDPRSGGFTPQGAARSDAAVAASAGGAPRSHRRASSSVP
jgi:hypothetical protein